MRSILIKCAPVARTHEQPRLLKPTNRATKVRAVDRKNLEVICVDSADPARHLGRVSVPGLADRVPIHGQSRLALGKAIQRTERNPTVRGLPLEARQYETEKGDAHKDGRNAIQSGSHL